MEFKELVNGDIVATAYGRLDSVSGEGKFRTVSDQANLVLTREDSSNFSYSLNVLTNERLYLVTPVVSELHLQYNQANRTLAWATEQRGSPVAFKLTFGSAKEATDFTISLFIALVEHGRQESFAKATEQDRDWVQQVAQTNIDGDEDYKDIEEDRQAFAASDFLNTSRYASPVRAKGKNVDMEVGIALNRTYVNRGAELDVFRHDADDRLESVATLPPVRDLSGEYVSPTKTMLHEKDTRLLMLDDREDRVLAMDLERGKVISEWTTGGTPIRSINPMAKYAQRTAEDMINAINENTLFTIDPRINSPNKTAQKFEYAKSTKAKLSTLATTGAGHLAVGSETGEIRLFREVGQRAKNLLPGLGVPIRAMDVSEVTI